MTGPHAPTAGRARPLPALVLLAFAVLGCRERAAELVHFRGSVGAPPPPAAEEPREVHFTFTAPDAVTFDWSGGGRTVRVWAKNVPPQVIEAHAPSPVPSSSPGPWYEATAEGLVAGTEYYYEVGNPVRPVPLSFRTPPARGGVGFSFVAVGDVGATSEWPAAATLHRLIKISDPSFVLMLGDLTYATPSNVAAVDRHFDEVMLWSRRAAYMPVWGNHEWEEGAGLLANYKGRFALPHAAAAKGAPTEGGRGEDWYWFDYGAVRFIVYPEPYAHDTWADWAAQAERLFSAAQADRALRFIVTAGHRTAYSSGHHGGNEPLRAILDDFGRRFPKYVLNLAGHSHVYERTKPQAHVVHLTAGIGGGALEHGGTECPWPSCKPPAFTAARALHHGLLRVQVRADLLRVEAVCGAAAPAEDDVHCAEGEIFDAVEIPPGATPVAAGSRKHGPAEVLNE